MFQDAPIPNPPLSGSPKTDKDLDIIPPGKYKNIINNIELNKKGSSENNANVDNYHVIDQLLENEKQHNKTETWTKLDKTLKIQKLHQFAEKYGRENALPVKDIKSLKLFFVQCIEKNKLQKTKDIIYNKDTREITSVPPLYFNTQNHNFSLKIMDSKRVSTLKSLTPKRISEKNTEP
jgi:hypothetical protein